MHALGFTVVVGGGEDDECSWSSILVGGDGDREGSDSAVVVGGNVCFYVGVGGPPILIFFVDAIQSLTDAVVPIVAHVNLVSKHVQPGHHPTSDHQ